MIMFFWDRVMRNHFVVKILWKNLPEGEDIRDNLLWFGTTPSDFATSNFTDEIFFLEGKNYNDPKMQFNYYE